MSCKLRYGPWYVYFKKEQISKDGAFIVVKESIKEYRVRDLAPRTARAIYGQGYQRSYDGGVTYV